MRETPVTLRRRLAARLAAAIRDGEPAPGSRLPGVRAMADQLGVHRHTVAAAYRELADAGLVRTVPGGGTYVAPLGLPGAEGELPADPFRRFVMRERAAGARAAELAEACRRWRRQLDARRILLVEPEHGLRCILLHELWRALPLPVVPVSPGRLQRQPDLALEGVPVGRPRVLSPLLSRLPAGAEAIPLRLAGGGRQLRLVERLPPRSAVACVTVSSLVRRRARELLEAARLRGTGVTLPAPDDPGSLARALRVARLVFADALCARLPALRACRRRLEVRLVGAEWMARVSHWLEGLPG